MKLLLLALAVGTTCIEANITPRPWQGSATPIKVAPECTLCRAINYFFVNDVNTYRAITTKEANNEGEEAYKYMRDICESKIDESDIIFKGVCYGLAGMHTFVAELWQKEPRMQEVCDDLNVCIGKSKLEQEKAKGKREVGGRIPYELEEAIVNLKEREEEKMKVYLMDSADANWARCKLCNNTIDKFLEVYRTQWSKDGLTIGFAEEMRLVCKRIPTDKFVDRGICMYITLWYEEISKLMFEKPYPKVLTKYYCGGRYWKTGLWHVCDEI